MATATKREQRTQTAPVVDTEDLAAVETNFDTEYDDRPPNAGLHKLILTRLRSFGSNYSKKKGRSYLNAQVDIQISPDSEDEGAAGRSINFVQFGHFFIRDLFKAWGYSRETIPTKGDETKALIEQLGIEQQQPFPGRIDWEAFSVPAYNARLVEVTEAESVEEARKVATSDQKQTAANFARIKATVTEFPLDEETGQRIATVTCPHTGAEVTARAVLKKVVVPAS